MKLRHGCVTCGLAHALVMWPWQGDAVWCSRAIARCRRPLVDVARGPPRSRAPPMAFLGSGETLVKSGGLWTLVHIPRPEPRSPDIHRVQTEPRPILQSSGRHNFVIQTPSWVNQNSISFISTSSSTWFSQNGHLMKCFCMHIVTFVPTLT